MSHLRAHSKVLLTLLCVLLVVMRVSGAHLHLCLDGSEPPATLHMEDAGIHHDDHNNQSHSDVDVSLSADTLVKKLDLSFDSPLLLTLFLLASIVFLSTVPRIRFDFFPHLHSQRAFIRPPLRGPPL